MFFVSNRLPSSQAECHRFDPGLTLKIQRQRGREDALHLRSVYRITTAFHGLRCHPLTYMLLKIRLIDDSSFTRGSADLGAGRNGGSAEM